MRVDFGGVCGHPQTLAPIIQTLSEASTVVNWLASLTDTQLDAMVAAGSD